MSSWLTSRREPSASMIACRQVAGTLTSSCNSALRFQHCCRCFAGCCRLSSRLAQVREQLRKPCCGCSTAPVANNSLREMHPSAQRVRYLKQLPVVWSREPAQFTIMGGRDKRCQVLSQP